MFQDTFDNEKTESKESLIGKKKIKEENLGTDFSTQVKNQLKNTDQVKANPIKDRPYTVDKTKIEIRNYQDLIDQAKKEKEEATTDGLDGTPGKIIAILDEYIRPAVASDGGNIAFKSYDEESKVVSVILQGACSGCPSSTITLKNGIETMLKEMLPNEISEVVAING